MLVDFYVLRFDAGLDIKFVVLSPVGAQLPFNVDYNVSAHLMLAAKFPDVE